MALKGNGAVRSKQSAADERKAALVHHAREQLAIHGVQEASLNQILQLAGGSKATLVKYFGNKNGLFAAAMAETVEEAFSKRLLTEEDDQLDMEESITALARGILAFYLTPEAMTIYRGVVATSATGNGIGAAFYNNGYLVVQAKVARYLERWRNHGLADNIDIQAEAERLTHVVRSGLYERVLLGLTPLPAPREEIDACAVSAARLFLYGVCGPARGPIGHPQSKNTAR